MSCKTVPPTWNSTTSNFITDLDNSIVAWPHPVIIFAILCPTANRFKWLQMVPRCSYVLCALFSTADKMSGWEKGWCFFGTVLRKGQRSSNLLQHRNINIFLSRCYGYTCLSHTVADLFPLESQILRRINNAPLKNRQKRPLGLCETPFKAKSNQKHLQCSKAMACSIIIRKGGNWQ